MTDKENNAPSTVERWIAPITAGVVVAVITTIVQLLVQPAVSLRSERNVSHFNQKRDAYVKAGGLVNRMWLALDWRYGERKVKATQSPPSAAELNDCAMLLFMVADDPTIPKIFTDMMFNVHSNYALKLNDRFALFNAMRKDLYGAEVPGISDLKDMPYLFDSDFTKMDTQPGP